MKRKRVVISYGKVINGIPYVVAPYNSNIKCPIVEVEKASVT